MKVLNNINIDFNFDGERVYELTVKCNNSEETAVASTKLAKESNLIVDFLEINSDGTEEITVISEAWRFQTKKDFIKEVKAIVK